MLVLNLTAFVPAPDLIPFAYKAPSLYAANKVEPDEFTNINKDDIEVEKIIYKCDLCNKTFKTDYLLNKHKNSKIKCTENNKKEKTTNDFLDIKQIKKKINNIQYQMQKKRTESISCIDNKCNYCNVIFTRKQNLIRHLDNNNCSIKKNMLQQIETLNSEANKYIIMKNKIIADLQKENKIINKANNNITNNTDNSSNTNITRSEEHTSELQSH